jgi:cystathionine beta-synthase
VITDKISDLIGSTPLLRLAVADGNMIDEAEERGLLAPGGRLVESTSGNTGVGLALIAAERGYKFSAVIDNHSSADKRRAMQAYGAELVNVGGQDDALATAERDAVAERMAIEHGAYWTAQHLNEGNPNSYKPVARELTDALGERIDWLYGAVGTGGSLCGTGRSLRERIPGLRIVGVEPLGSVVFGGPGAPYHQSGTGTPAGAEIGHLVDYDLIGDGVTVTDAEAFETCRYLARRYGILVGGSAGGVIYKALERARTVPLGTVIVVLVCDGGEKYLDTVYNDDWMAAEDLFDARVVNHLESMLR